MSVDNAHDSVKSVEGPWILKNLKIPGYLLVLKLEIMCVDQVIYAGYRLDPTSIIGKLKGHKIKEIS